MIIIPTREMIMPISSGFMLNNHLWTWHAPKYSYRIWPFVACSTSTCLTKCPASCIWYSSWLPPSSLQPSCCWLCSGSPCWDWLRAAAARRTVRWPARSSARVSTCWRRTRGAAAGTDTVQGACGAKMTLNWTWNIRFSTGSGGTLPEFKVWFRTSQNLDGLLN